MKKIFSILALLPVFVFILHTTSCDKIESPFKPVYGDLDTSLYPGPGFYVFPEFDATFPSSVENVLIEDFTGHRCGNCPEAAIIAHDLKEANPGRVFVASVHEGGPDNSFQEIYEPGDEGYPKYNHDFRTEEGAEYYEDIDGFFGNPMGMINRKSDGSTAWKFKGFWAAAVNDIITSSAALKMNIQVKTNYYTETRGLFVHVQSKTLTEMDGRYSMVVCLIDDEYIDWQKDYSMPPDQHDVEFYHHKDVFLGTVNGAYGTQLFDAGAPANEVYENHFSMVIPEGIELDSSSPDEASGLSIIAYLMNRDTYEIVQVIEEKIKVSF